MNESCIYIYILLLVNIYSNKSLSGNPSAENPLSFGTLCIETRLTECMFGEVAQQNVHIISPN